MASDHLLTIDDLSVDFRSGPEVVHAVQNVSFTLDKGETLALVGESGSGKTVTALSILRLLPYPAASHPSGRITLDGIDVLNASGRDIRHIRGKKVGMIFQEPMTALNPLHTIEKQIAEVLELHLGMRQEQARARVLELLDLVGIHDPESRLSSYVHQLSGGQRQRVMVAMALAGDPDLLIADEPTTALDVTVQAQVLDLIKELQKKLDMGILLITHDLGVVRRISDRAVVMREGRAVEENDIGTLFANPRHEYTKMLLGAEDIGRPAPMPENTPHILTTDDLKVWFPIRRGVLRRTVGHVKAVDGVDVSVRRGESIGIVGESGSGKSTLAFAVLRLVSSEGAIEFDGVRLDELSKKEMRPHRREIQVVFQDPFGSLSPRMSVREIIAEGLDVHSVGTPQERDELVARTMSEVGLDPEWRHRYPHEFSGGQRQRIAIARALVLKPKIIILDEPTSALDRSVQFQVMTLLRELQQKHGLTYLFIAHDLKVVRSLCHSLIVMKEGKVVESGLAESVFANPRDPYTKRLFEAAFETSAPSAP